MPPMNVEAFYQGYGQYILQSQKNLGTNKWWPYLPLIIAPKDIPIEDVAIRDKFKCYGVVYQGNIAAVLYQEGFITYLKIPSYCAAISYQFTGCYMAKLCFKKEWYIFHISTSESSKCDCKSVWREFLNNYKNDISDIFMFKPTDNNDIYVAYQNALFQKPRPALTLSCLINAQNQGYALLLDVAKCTVYGGDENIASCNDKSSPF